MTSFRVEKVILTWAGVITASAKPGGGSMPVVLGEQTGVLNVWTRLGNCGRGWGGDREQVRGRDGQILQSSTSHHEDFAFPPE